MSFDLSHRGDQMHDGRRVGMAKICIATGEIERRALEIEIHALESIFTDEMLHAMHKDRNLRGLIALEELSTTAERKHNSLAPPLERCHIGLKLLRPDARGKGKSQGSFRAIRHRGGEGDDDVVPLRGNIMQRKERAGAVFPDPISNQLVLVVHAANWLGGHS